jgi:hypothetical protein
VHLEIVFDRGPFVAQFERTSDGREITASDPDEGDTVSSLRWDGDALLFVDRGGPAGAEVTISFRYGLEAGGGRLRAVEQLRGGGRDQDNVWVFDRA